MVERFVEVARGAEAVIMSRSLKDLDRLPEASSVPTVFQADSASTSCIGGVL